MGKVLDVFSWIDNGEIIKAFSVAYDQFSCIIWLEHEMDIDMISMLGMG